MRSRTRFIISVSILCLALLPEVAAAGPGTAPIKLELVSPEKADQGPPKGIQYRAGWPLVFRLKIKDKDMLGIALEGDDENIIWPFPEPHQAGYVVFEDPDGCWSLNVAAFCEPEDFPDETFLQYHPDIADLVGVADDGGSPFLQEALADPEGRPWVGGPVLLNDGGIFQEFFDGVGYGPDDDLPGLVLLSDTGAGVVRTPPFQGWERVVPEARWNLGGFLTSVAYELTDDKGGTSLLASLVAPRHLFSELRLVDHCLGDFDGLDCSGLVQIGEPGEPPIVIHALQQLEDGSIEPLEGPNDESVAEIRAFVVHSKRNEPDHPWSFPKTIVDMNGDGLVGAADAELMGYELLSNEVVLHVAQIGNAIGFCQGFPSIDTRRGTDVYFDLDGNGYALTAIFCPGGGAGVTPPPR